MRKQYVVILMAAMMAAAGSFTAWAGTWEQSGTDWRYMQDDGTYAVNGWQWIDGNGDGIAECYYFDGNGYMLSSTMTPDGYQVNADGAWTIDNFTQTKVVSTDTPEPTGSTVALSGYNEYGVSLAAADMLESTMEENAAKYGVKSQFDMSGKDYITYNNDIQVIYYNGKVLSAQSKIPSLILKGLDDSLVDNSDDDQRLADLKNNGYTDSYTDSVVTVTSISKWELHWYKNRLDIGIKASYR